jgi:calcium binding protein 39
MGTTPGLRLKAIETETCGGEQRLKAGDGSQLLGEILLHRANVKAMMRYVSEVDNLKLMMVLLKDQSRSIQFEAFHVFKARR